MSHRGSLLFLVLMTGCGVSPPSAPSALPPVPPAKLEADGLHNLFQVSDRLYSGSSPEGDAGFASLGRLGVKTVISVDGARPDVSSAEKHGLRYVHLPIGYDGISSERVMQLAKAVRDLPGPVYIHCHHGKHRGPAACAAVQLTLDPSWNSDTATSWMKAAGTDPKYQGLTEVARTFRATPAAVIDAASAEFPATSKVADLVRVMVEVDERWDHLKAIKANQWKTPKEHADLDPPHEALMLMELYREAARLDDAKLKGKEFIELLSEGESAARELEGALRAANSEHTAAAFNRSQAACAKCHEKYRDRK